MANKKLKVIDNKPKLRSDCEFCHVCQLWREESIEDQEILPCGHKNSEAIFRSRPCVFVSCKHNLYLDVLKSGNIKLIRNIKPGKAKNSCVLDEVEEGGLTTVEIGELLNIDRVRVEQIEKEILNKLKESTNKEVRKFREMKTDYEIDQESETFT